MSWIAGSDSGSQTLSEDDDLYETHVNELRVAVNASMREVFNVKGAYGAVGDGDTDDTTAIQNALDAGAGAIVYFPKGDYKISTTLTISADTTIIGYNARIFNVTTHIYLITGASGMKIYGLELEGVEYATSNGSARGISIVGTSGSEKEEIIIKDCYIHDIGFYGILAEYCKNVSISNTRIINIGYAGVMSLSSDKVDVDHCHIKNVASNQVNEYGVAFSSANAAANPRSKYGSVTNSLIEDVTDWEGIDTHGGLGIKILNNVVKGCSRGIVLKMRPSSGTAIDSATDCVVSGNTVYGGGNLGCYVNGTSDVYAYNNVISNNVFYYCGTEGGAVESNGTIQLSRCKGTVVSNNVIYGSYINGIYVNRGVNSFVISGNSIIDVQDTTRDTIGIYVLTNCQGLITGNHIYIDNAALNINVGDIGVFVGSNSANDVTIGLNNKISFTTAYSLTDIRVNWGTLGTSGAKVHTYAGSPENVITAAIGSICINTNGGSGTTLYIKESGSDSSGWVGK